MNSLLERQLRKHGRETEATAAPALLEAISSTYDEFEQERRHLEHVLLVTSEELTEANENLRREAELRLASLTQKYQQTLELQEGMILCLQKTARGFESTLCRGELVRKLGLDPKRVEGSTIDQVASPETAPLLNAQLERAWAGESLYFSYTSRPSDVEVYVVLRPRLENGAVCEIIASCIEITTLKAAERELRAAKERAESADRAKSMHLPPFWASGKEPRPTAARKRPEALVPTVTAAIAGAVQELRVQAATLPQLVGAFGQMIKQAVAPEVRMALPFAAPRSVLNGRVREKRRFATQQFSLARMKALAAAAECTLNDVVLAMCGSALRRFLEERGSLPEKPLTAGIPVSVRPKDDDRNGNAITFIVSTLGTDIADVRERLAAIRQSVKLAKEHVQSLPRQAMMQYTVLLMAPTILTLLTGIGGRTRPMFNITISNVPGPETPLYFRGAEMVASYPASIVTHGQALNITCQSYAGFMNFGFTGCHSSMPSMQRLAVYTAEALAELEAAFLPVATPRKTRPAPKPKAAVALKRAVKEKTV